jgi:hypothetical protein
VALPTKVSQVPQCYFAVKYWVPVNIFTLQEMASPFPIKWLNKAHIILQHH